MTGNNDEFEDLDDDLDVAEALPAELSVEVEDGGDRIDVVVGRFPGVSRSQAARSIAAGAVRIGDRLVTRASERVPAGSMVTVRVERPSPIDAMPEDLDLAVVFEDRDVIVVNKRAGMVVHPAPGHASGTLVNGLLYHCGDLSGIGGALRPGIVHRIDRDTSGLLVATKNDNAHQWLAAQFAAHTVERQYLAICLRLRGPGLEAHGRIESGHGRAPNERKRFTGQLDTPRRAITNYRVLERLPDGALFVSLQLETGRTHQIRVHMSELGCPLLGDPLYGGRAAINGSLIQRTALHAATLGFTLPGGSRVRFAIDPPRDFADALEALRHGRSWRA